MLAAFRRKLAEMSLDVILPGLFAWVIPAGNNTHRIESWQDHRFDGRSVEECYDIVDTSPMKDRFAKAKK